MEKEDVDKLIRKKIAENPKALFPYKSLTELGLSRYACKVCGKNFWSAVKKDICGNVDCVGDYGFFDKRLTSLKSSYMDLWKRFSTMFAGFGHKEISRYPVVARWRDDIYFVEAAIDDFAPYVINGVADAPANPLVVPQICFRFNDINNVGLTGRHLTSFIMAEQATFNTKHKKTYFDSEAIKYIFAWLTKGLGISKNDITFIEDTWVGAGYAGNCLEFFVGGLELGNQVYMRYSVTKRGLDDLESKTIDMGAGLDRWAWITQGTPTVYEAVFPKVIDFLKKRAGVDYDDQILKKVYKHMGRIDFEKTSIEEELPALSKLTGIEHAALKEMLYKMQAIYSIADHTRTLLVAIHDGALPSNVGGGYNLRNLIRRTFDFIEANGWAINVNDVIDEHKKEFGSWFTELNDFDLSAVINKEKERYGEFKYRNTKLISSLIAKGRIEEAEMRELYESKGITIDDIKHQARAEKKNIVLPERFYTTINKRDFAEVNKIDERLLGLPETKKLFYDEKLTQTKAKILKVIGGNGVILDKTIFYPEMGGQKPDGGEIDGIKVVDVALQSGIIVHKLEQSFGKPVGKSVTLKVDVERRELLRKHHTATHIVNQASRRVLGEFVYQNGAEKDVDMAHLDITYFDRLTSDQINEIERLANSIVADNLKINVNIINRTDAEMKYGMSIYQGGAIPNAKLRIVNIGDYDVEACGGLHCDRSGDVGVIKITKAEKIQDGVVRLTFMAYKPAIAYIEGSEKIIKDLSSMWGVKREDVYKTAERFFSEAKSFRELYKKAATDDLMRAFDLLMHRTENGVRIMETKLDDFGLLAGALKGFAANGKKGVIFSDTIGLGCPKNDDSVKELLIKRYKNVAEKGEFLFGHN